jgi:hypothetical protein
MPDAQEIQSVLDGAERAASSGDYAAAERLLREAASLQGSTLGTDHPDLANTFNNLGIVCELTEKPDDAEAFFRKSFAIAAASLEPGHPFVATSRKNLEDFCAARGRPVDVPAATPAVEQKPAPPHPVEMDPLSEPDATFLKDSAPVVEPAAPSGQRLLAIGIGVFIGVFLLALLIVWLRGRDGTSVASTPGTPATASASTPAPPSEATTPAPAQTRQSPPAAADDRPASVPPSAVQRSRPSHSAGPQPDVASAQLCTALSTASSWHCAAAGETVAAGTLYFYTRIKSATATTVQHRWYRDDRLRQSVELAVSPNTKEGYRTYSKSTVSGAGQWRVELRGKDGTVLREERFLVRNP